MRWMNTSRKQAKVRGCWAWRIGLTRAVAVESAWWNSTCNFLPTSMVAVKQYESKLLHRSFFNLAPFWLRRIPSSSKVIFRQEFSKYLWAVRNKLSETSSAWGGYGECDNLEQPKKNPWTPSLRYRSCTLDDNSWSNWILSRRKEYWFRSSASLAACSADSWLIWFNIRDCRLSAIDGVGSMFWLGSVNPMLWLGVVGGIEWFSWLGVMNGVEAKLSLWNEYGLVSHGGEWQSAVCSSPWGGSSRSLLKLLRANLSSIEFLKARERDYTWNKGLLRRNLEFWSPLACWITGILHFVDPT